jgi:MFS family permease
MAANATLALPRQDAKVIGLVSAGHFFSHFYMLLLPPLFPLLREIYGVGYTELGFAIAAFSVTTGLTQVPVGFLVDRYGARNILIAGIYLEALAVALIGVFPYYGALLALMVLAGLANAVYHPADYAILNASVNQQRMGRAFSIHTFAGYLGDALAPVTILFLATLANWRVGLVVCGIAGAITATLMLFHSVVLRDVGEHAGAKGHSKTAGRSGLALLFSAPILMGLLFFVCISLAGRGVNGFSVATLNALYDTPLETAAIVLSAFLFASPVGVLIGGWIADRVSRHDIVAALCFVVSGLAIFTVAAVEMALPAIAGLFAIAGFCSGLVAPSRDMMIRSVTPPGEMGKVFGFVSTGFNIGGIIGPILFGYLLDHTDPRLVFWTVAGVSVLTVLTVLETGRRGRQ